MPTLLIRDVDESVKTRLQQLAKHNRRSMQAQTKLILEDAVKHADNTGWLSNFAAQTALLRGEFVLPQRTAGRESLMF